MSVPRLKVLKREFKVAMLVDNFGIIVDCYGRPVGGSLVFGGCPDGIAEMGSSLVALYGDKMELYGKKSGKRVQKILLAGEGAGLHVIADDGNRSGKVVVVATSSKVMSNGLYNSIEHRAMVNATKERISLAMFFNPKLDADVGPEKSLLKNSGNPPIYRTLVMEQYLKEFFSAKL